MQLTSLVTIALALASSAVARPSRRSYMRRADFDLKNGQDAIAQNTAFSKLTPDSPCTEGTDACVDDKFAQCVSGKFVIQACAATTVCAALPLVNSAGTSITCTTPADRDARIAATGANTAAAGGAADTGANNAGTGAATGNNNGTAAADSGDPQKSLTLDPKVIAKGFENDGQDVPTAGQVASATSSNNFINFCLTVPNKPITNGQQIKTGSCNPAPMGVIAATTNMPSGKFLFPENLATLQANKKFTIKLALKHLDAGHFTNANANYYAAPQQVNAGGDIIGHTHVVIEKMDSLTSTTVTDPQVFAFFKGVNGALEDGAVTADVADGLPVGVYRLASINAAANHQPVVVAVAQHGALDDTIYFTVTADGKPAAAAAAAAAAPAATAKGKKN